MHTDPVLPDPSFAHSRPFAVSQDNAVRPCHEKAIGVRVWSYKALIIDGDGPAYGRRDCGTNRKWMLMDANTVTGGAVGSGGVGGITLVLVQPALEEGAGNGLKPLMDANGR
jgi:hypothetical protein